MWFFMAALLGAFITSIYTGRMVFVTFFGDEKTHVAHVPGKGITIPLVVLAILSLAGGFIELPHTLGHITIFSDFLDPVVPTTVLREGAEASEWIIQLIAAVVALLGVYVSYVFYVKKPALADEMKNRGQALHAFWLGGWGFDTLYNTVFVRPFVYLATVNKRDVIDRLYDGMVLMAEWFHALLSATQNGRLRWYVLGIVIGALFILTLTILTG